MGNQAFSATSWSASFLEAPKAFSVLNQIVEDFIVDFVNKYGKEVLPEVAKLSFKTTKKLFGDID